MAQQPQPATRPLPDIADPDKQSFLKLPAEVRHQIYAYWAEEVLHVGVRARGKAHTTSAHPVGGASRRLHKEFGGVLGEVSVANAQQVRSNVPVLLHLRGVDYQQCRWVYFRSNRRTFHAAEMQPARPRPHGMFSTMTSR